MLDLMTLAVSCGLQNELENVRKERGGEAFEQEAATPSSSMSGAADVIGSGLNAVENCVSQAVSSMIPSYQMVQEALPSSLPTVTVDLTLPTRAKKC